jgi:tRNA modification GTPase
LNDSDTIAAIATAPGQGGVGVVRISGPLAPDIARFMLGQLPQPRLATLARFRDDDGALLDQGLALYFPAPRSYTGEAVLELHAHGGPVVLDLILKRALELGARPARPGEFTERAFLNDKLDLAQAEAVADLIASGSEAAARAAARSLEGTFSTTIHALVEALTQLRMYLEATLDFPEEEIDLLADGAALTRLDAIGVQLATVRASARQGRLLREGLTLVIAGQPNVGKSSLMNRLAGHDAAIVTEHPGTTRDLLRERIQLDGIPLHLIDTAGLRDCHDPIEQEGVRRAWREIERADRVLLVVDDRSGVGEAEETLLARLPAALPVTVVRNKIDLSGRAGGITCEGDRCEIALSALDGRGFNALHAHLKQAAGYQPQGEGLFLARRRHLDALEHAAAHLTTARAQLTDHHSELAAEELRLAQRALGTITGEVASDDLLGRIFSEFCIGK